MKFEATARHKYTQYRLGNLIFLTPIGVEHNSKKTDLDVLYRDFSYSGNKSAREELSTAS